MFRDIRARVPIGYVELLAIGAIVLLALLLRTVNLSGLPAGFHGDEAVIGLEAQRILREGDIGPYSPYAAGQPTGPIYLTALSIRLLDNSVFAVRIVPALLGTLTVLALYIVVRRNVGIPATLIGAATLAVMSWHIHFARIGFPLEAWPLVAVLMVGAFTEALRRRDWRWWATAGALTGAGIYVYNAHPLLAGATVLGVAGYLAFNRSVPLRRDLVGVAAFTLALMIVLVPMARYALADDTKYWDHFQESRLIETNEWQELDGSAERGRFLASRYVDVWDRLSREPEEDLVDGTGMTVIIPPIMLLLASFGIVIGLWRYRSPLVYLGTLIIVIMPLGSAITSGGELRRALVIAPFLAMFCGLGAVAVLDVARRRGRAATAGAAVAVAILTGVVTYQNLDLYFGEFAEPEIQEQVLGTPMADAAIFMDSLPDGNYVYFYSNKWSFNYATRLYLAPNASGTDRSHRFGTYSLDIEPEHGTPVFVFLGDYLNAIETARDLYPGHEITPNTSDGEPTFRAYLPNKSNRATHSSEACISIREQVKVGCALQP